MKKDRLNVYFDPSLTAELEALAARRKVSKSQVVEAALASYLSPDAADQRGREDAARGAAADGPLEGTRLKGAGARPIVLTANR